MSDACLRYVRDLFYSFRESASEARYNKVNLPSDKAYHEGREMAYIEVLMKMQSLADSFMIPQASLGIADFDPLVDEIDPGKQSTNRTRSPAD